MLRGRTGATRRATPTTSPGRSTASPAPSTSRSARPTDARRTAMRVLSLRALVRLAFTIAMLVLALLGSALLHLRTPLGRQVGLDLLNVYVTQLIAGRLHAQRIERIG